MAERLELIITESGSKIVRRDIRDIGRAAEDATRPIFQLQRALRTIGGLFAAREILTLVDTFNSLQNKLRVVTDGTAELSFVTAQLAKIAEDTRSSFEATATLYQRLAINSRQLGVTQQELLQFTESLNKAIIVSGASAQEARNAMIQFSQGLASGRLQGDELRSVLEQLPVVADIIAQRFGVTRGELRILGQQGKLTAKEILAAFRDARNELADRFGKTVPTIAQSFEILRTKVILFLADLNKLSAFTTTLNSILGVFGDNLATVGTAIAAVGAAFISIKLGEFITNLGKSTIETAKYAKALFLSETGALADARAERDRAQAIYGSSRALEITTRAKLADLQLDQVRLQQTIALAQAQRQQAIVQVELAQGIAEATGRTSLLTKAIQTRNNATKALLATRQAEKRVSEAIVATEVQLAAQINRTNVAQERLAAKTVAAGRGAVFAATAFKGLRAILTFFGGPLGAIFTAISVGLLVMGNNTSRVTELTQELESNVNDLSQAFEKAGGHVENLKKELQTLTLTEAIANAEKFRNEFNDALSEIAKGIKGIQEEPVLKSDRNTKFAEGLERIKNALKDTGDITAFRQGLDQLIQSGDRTNRSLLDLAKRVLKNSKEFEGLDDKVQRAEAVVAILSGTATDAQRELLGLGDSANKAAQGISSLGAAANTTQENLRALQDFIPALKEQNKAIEDTAKANSIYTVEMKRAEEALRSGEISTLDFIARQKLLKETFRGAISEIDGTSDALGKLADYQKDVNLDSIIDPKARKLAAAKIEYENIRSELIKTGASQDALNQLTDAYQQKIANINNEVTKLGANAQNTVGQIAQELQGEIVALSQGGLGTFDQRVSDISKRLIDANVANYQEALAALIPLIRQVSALQEQNKIQDTIKDYEQEGKILKQNVGIRDSYTKILALEREFRRNLTEEEKAGIVTAQQELDLIKARAAVTDATATAVYNFNTNIEAYNQLLSEGVITQNQFRVGTEEAYLAMLKFADATGNGSFVGGFLIGLEQMAFSVKDFTAEAGKLMGGFINDFASGFSRAIVGVIEGTTSLKDALVDVARTALESLLQGLIKLGIQYVLNAALGQVLAAQATATAVAQGAIIAAAYAPAAAAVSLATAGANAIPAQAGITATHALSQTLSALAEGGQVSGPGTGTSDSILAFLSNGEFVVNAAATKRFLPLLEQINKVKYAEGGYVRSSGLTNMIPTRTDTQQSDQKSTQRQRSGNDQISIQMIFPNVDRPETFMRNRRQVVNQLMQEIAVQQKRA